MKSESDSENDAAEFPTYIVLEFLEETCQVKLSCFLIEKLISEREQPFRLSMKSPIHSWGWTARGVRKISSK